MPPAAVDDHERLVGGYTEVYYASTRQRVRV